MKALNTWTRKELLALPHRAWDKETTYTSILILQSTNIHDSGYRCFIIIGCMDAKPVEIITEWADDLNWFIAPQDLPSYSYAPFTHMDCMKKSGAIRVWKREYKFKIGAALSSTDISLIKES